jgi:N utilization substance protein A
VNTVEALADMTPEQLEAIEGIGPKTVEKISLAVNNYFASLEQGTPIEGAVEEVAAEGEAVAEAVKLEAVEASDDITAEMPAVADIAASADEAEASDVIASPVASTDEGTFEADALAGESEREAEDSEEQKTPEEESASETRE